MINQQYKNLNKFIETLERIQLFDRLKKTRTILLIIFLVVALTVEAASLWGVKAPGYDEGYKNGYRESYKAAFDGNIYNVTAGFINVKAGFISVNHSYNDGYLRGYDEGYPEGQFDRVAFDRVAIQERENSQDHGTSQDNETIQNNKTSQNGKASQNHKTSASIPK